MIELCGKFNKAIVYTDNIEEKAMSQIIELCNQEFAQNSKIRIMPDTHAGAGCVIGTTMTIKNKIVPNLVGVDIGCGMETVLLKQKEIDLAKLDDIIYSSIPSAFNIRNEVHTYVNRVNFDELRCKEYINFNRAKLSIGTLGGGNHFIEVNKDESGNLYLVVHSGSRYLGKQVAEFYQKKAYDDFVNLNEQKQEVINKLKAQGREKDIQSEINKIKTPKINKSLAYVQNENFENYINDMKIVQMYAVYNRKAIIDEIIKQMDLDTYEQFTTIHNYIELDNMILRKGAISAQQNEKVLIPINMRDGSLICIGKGNPEWNYSAPHGAGRLMSRSKAKKIVSLEEFKSSMKGIYTTSVNHSTIDESPMAYKPMEEIINNIQGTVELINIIRHIYNFKA